jgi:hypothetical protein
LENLYSEISDKDKQNKQLKKQKNNLLKNRDDLFDFELAFEH